MMNEHDMPHHPLADQEKEAGPSHGVAAPRQPSIAMLGFGEAAMAMVQGWQAMGRNDGFTISGYDIKLNGHADESRSKLQDFDANAVAILSSQEERLTGQDVILSLVTADQADHAAKQAALSLSAGSFYLDCNSCAPQTKRHAAIMIEAAGGHYIDCAIMAPIHPKKHETPMLFAGPKAEAFLQAHGDLFPKATRIKGAVGKASTMKMVRSTMIKGMEALVAECFLAAACVGIEDDIIASLEASFPGFDWQRRGAYMLERMTTHGQRRSAELHEVAKTLAGLGLVSSPEETMAHATANWQHKLGALELENSNQSDVGLHMQMQTILQALAKSELCLPELKN